MKRCGIVWFLLLILALSATAAQYGDDGSGGVSLHFSGHLTAAGATCEQVSQTQLDCQVPVGGAGTIELDATVTPSAYPVSISAVSLPPWASFSPVSGYGTIQGVCSFLPPAEAGGESFHLVFRAFTVYGISIDLTVVLNVSQAAGHYTDEEGRFSVPVEDLPDTTLVAGRLTESTGRPLAGVPVEVTLVPKPGRPAIENLDDVGGVRISTPYGSIVVTAFNLLSSIDPYGRVSSTIDLGTVRLPPESVIPAGPVSGTTDEVGKFSVPLPSQPGTVVTGRLTEGGERPLPEQGFSLTPVWKEGEITGFTVAVSGYEPVTVTEFGRISLFGLTTYLLGDLSLHPEAPGGQAPSAFPVIVDLGTLPAYTWSEAFDLNDAGQVVGQSGNAEQNSRAFLWSDGEMTDLGTLPGDTMSSASGINDAGQVVGTSYSSDGRPRAFLWSDGVMIDLGALPHHTDSGARAINDAGQVVGNSYTPDRISHAFLWSDGEMIDLGTLPGDTMSSASGINDAGQVVGTSYSSDGRPRAFLWSDGVMVNLGALPSHIQAGANDINDRGEVVGRSVDADWTPHAFLWSDGVMTDLGANWTAHGINDAGQVVGTRMTGEMSVAAVLWEDGTLIDLNDLLPPDSGWELLEARDISDNGAIVGWGLHNGEMHAFYLVLSD